MSFQGNTPAFRVFDRIGQDIGNDLADPGLIPEKLGGNVLVNLNLKGKTFALQPSLCHNHKAMEHGLRLIFRRNDLHLAGVNLGKIQNIVDDAKQGVRRHLDVLCIFQDRILLALLKDHAIHAQDRIDGRTDLMGDRGKKHSLP